GLPALQADGGLALAARHHAQEMAQFHYLSHTSPTPGTITLAQRIAKAGLAVQTLGENIASIPFSATVAQEAVDGWLASPGHRANLLNPAFTHVGFGIATDENGLSYLVQDFAYRPLLLRTAHLYARTATRYRLDIALRSTTQQEAVVFYRDRNSEPFRLAPGRQTIRLDVTGPNPIHLGIGVQSSGSAYIVQDEGWLDLDHERFTPSASASRHTLTIESVSVSPRQKPMYEVELDFDRIPGAALAVWLNDQPLRSASVTGRRLSFELPQGSVPPVIDVGMQLQGSRYRVIMSLSVGTSDGRARLVAHSH
ncbi:MAG TPA: CAP domain-containing protein, partial [Trueperaceae bacterium]